jgi:iron complex transport system substrate-binding protein
MPDLAQQRPHPLPHGGSNALAWGQPVLPERIVCLTEETTEWLYLLGEERRIAGISGYTVRPPRARAEKPKVSAFLSAKIDKILALKPDLALGFSDMQAEIANLLIRAGVPVVVFNQRSVAEIFGVLRQVAALVGAADRAEPLLAHMVQRLCSIEAQAAALPRRPKVYFEEWDEPQISAIRWVSELIGLAGGDDCFAHLSRESLGKNRVIADPRAVIEANPDIIIGSWCGKKFRPERVAARPGWGDIEAVKSGQLFEIKSADILQPGPAALTDGVAQLAAIVQRWSQAQPSAATGD